MPYLVNLKKIWENILKITANPFLLHNLLNKAFLTILSNPLEIHLFVDGGDNSVKI